MQDKDVVEGERLGAALLHGVRTATWAERRALADAMALPEGSSLAGAVALTALFRVGLLTGAQHLLFAVDRTPGRDPQLAAYEVDPRPFGLCGLRGLYLSLIHI